MDNIAHGLIGAVIGYCGFRQRGGRAALWACIAAAEFSDADIVLAFVNGESYLRWHRAFTHSALALPFWAALVAGAFWAFSRRSQFSVLWQAAMAGMASHLFLDWITNYGTMLLWPVSEARFALNWVFIVDPYVWAMLGVALWLAVRSQRPVMARTGLAVVSGYFLLCAGSHMVAWRTAPKPLGVFAQPMNPFRWSVVWSDDRGIHWSDGRHNETFPVFRDDKLLPKAEVTSEVKLFRWFAAIPLVERREENGLTVLRYRDLRFRTRMPWGATNEGMFVVAKVSFDRAGNLVSSVLTSERG